MCLGFYQLKFNRPAYLGTGQERWVKAVRSWMVGFVLWVCERGEGGWGIGGDSKDVHEGRV